jgi:hypothetical protein
MKEVTHIEVWKETRDQFKRLAKNEGVSMKKLLDMWVKTKQRKK